MCTHVRKRASQQGQAPEIQHCGHDGSSMADRRIIDAFLFDAELDLLEHRFAETFDLVDTYILVEAGETFTGRPKPLTFAENRTRFSRFASKIKHVALPRLAADLRAGPWERERLQRNALLFALPGAGLRDVLLVLDADEIPSREVLERLRANGLDRPRRLLMTRHYQYADLLGPRSPCCPAPFEPFPQALGRKRPPQWDQLSIEWFSRSAVALPVEALQGSHGSVSQSPFDIRRLTPCAGALPAAGRHLCFVDPSSRPARKLERVSHTELAGARDRSGLHLSRCARYAVHHRGWWYAERPVGSLPQDLQRLVDRQPQLETRRRPAAIMLRRAVRCWAWVRISRTIPDALVSSVDQHFRLYAPGLVPLLLMLDILRAFAAIFMRAPRAAPGAIPKHFND
jgi:beta-1,4-mannosyl-glycoprotein beta-1,4-N-acetylglucosaminyltransferase